MALILQAREPLRNPGRFTALAYPAGGRTKTLTLREEDVAAVAAALERYDTVKVALDTRADADVQALHARVAARRERERRR